MRTAARRQVEEGRAPRTLPEIMAAYERVIIIQSLQHNGFSRKRTAASLGVSRTLLWRRMKLLGMDFSAVPRIITGRPRKGAL